LSLFVRSVSDVNIEELGFGTPGFEDQKTRFALRGLFSGTLLDLLTTRNNSKGKQTKVSIDFEGYSFPFLFCYARFVDELTIRNANGHAICQGIGSLDGKINSLGLFNTDIWLSFAGNKSSPIDRCIISSKHNNSFHYLTYKSCFFNELWVVDSYPTKVQEWLQSKRDIRHDTDFIKLDVHSIWILNSTLHCLGFRCFNKQIDNLFLVNNGFNYGTTSLVGLPQIDEVVIYDELKRPITINPLKAKNILWNESALDKYGLVIELAKTLDAKNPKLLYSKIDQIKELYGNKK